MLNFFNPVKAVSDYQSGLISQRGILFRRYFFFGYIFLSVFSIFFLPVTKYGLYDTFFSAIFLILYIGVPLLINTKIDGENFYTRLAVVHVPVLFTTLIISTILAVLTAVVVIFVIPTVNIDAVAFLLQTVLMFFSIFFMAWSFKKYKLKKPPQKI
ncbi:MAG: hypothetical protein AAB552_00425 [Patescibacteria group bacterium]